MQQHQACLLVVLALSSLSLTFAQTPSQSGETASSQHMIVPLASKKDGQLSGDPDKPGAAYVIRIQSDPNAIVPPHWHPEDEHIVVVKGTCSFGMGDRFDHNALRELNIGDYALMPKKMPHFGWAKTECIIQVHGIGPFQIIPASTEEHLSGWKNTPDGWLRDPQAPSFFKFRIADRVRSGRGEGMIVMGMHSEKSKFTQYRVQKDDGEAFFESEEELAAVSQAKGIEPNPLTGAWDGVLRGFQGDSPCTFYFRQEKGKLTGVFSLQWGGAVFNSVMFKNNALQIRMDTPLGNFLFNGEYREGALSGEWSTDTGLKGTWEVKKTVEGTGKQ